MRDPWLTIVGCGEDGPAGLPAASLEAVQSAEVVMGPKRHLSLLPETAGERVEWPAPFADGIPKLLELRGRRVVMLASGDPFWFGGGTTVSRHLDHGEWRALPAPSTFSLAAGRLGWPLEQTTCLGLHAAPLTRLRPHLAPGARLLVTLRNGEAVSRLAAWLDMQGFGESRVTVLEALGGLRERVRTMTASAYDLDDVAHPVAVAVEAAGNGIVLPRASGLPDHLFAHDGQITKRPVRAMSLSTLAPRPHETLWDIGAGSGSVGIEWLLSHPTTQAVAVEADTDRAARARENADTLGADRLQIVEGMAPDTLPTETDPDAVFIGGGLSEALLNRLWHRLQPGCRVVANAVTLESETLLAAWQAEVGGHLMRLDVAEAQPLGQRRGWRAAYPVVQWSVTR